MIVIFRRQGKGSAHRLFAGPPTKTEQPYPEAPDSQNSIPHPNSDADSLPYAAIVVDEERREGEKRGDGKED
jgi:hypothetical protein